MKPKRSFIAGLFGVMAVVMFAYAKLVRPWQLRWGATREEANRPSPGDGLVTYPAISTTRGITIQAPVDRVWPWVVQIGQRRGGFYSYDWLENLFVMDIHSADHINLEWQNPQVGQIIPFWKGRGIPIVLLDPPRLMVLGGSFVPEQPVGGSWSFSFESPDPQTTRLLVRARVAGFSPKWLSVVSYRLFLEPAHFIMERRMLLGIKERAEQPRKRSLSSNG
jgi:hypothetical protein